MDGDQTIISITPTLDIINADRILSQRTKGIRVLIEVYSKLSEWLGHYLRYRTVEEMPF